jgi:gliding motility-associated lipoprotein GldH
MARSTFIFLLFIFILSLQACDYKPSNDVFEKTIFFKDHQWPASKNAISTFTITDTASSYNIYAVIRHTDDFHYNNIWLNITSVPPGDTARSKQFNIKLGDNSQWLGSAMDDIIEHRSILFSNVRLKKGNYSFFLKQIMREDPLQNVLNAGIRVEKVVP